MFRETKAGDEVLLTYHIGHSELRTPATVQTVADGVVTLNSPLGTTWHFNMDSGRFSMSTEVLEDILAKPHISKLPIDWERLMAVQQRSRELCTQIAAMARKFASQRKAAKDVQSLENLWEHMKAVMEQQF